MEGIVPFECFSMPTFYVEKIILDGVKYAFPHDRCSHVQGSVKEDVSIIMVILKHTKMTRLRSVYYWPFIASKKLYGKGNNMALSLY